MIHSLDKQTLSTGEELAIVRVDAPDDALGPAVNGLLAHKGEHWRDHVRAALCGETDALETRFYLGLIGDEPVANIMTVEKLGVGLLGHVFTRPEHRRKGICKAVMARQMDDFRARDGHVLLLGTGFESAAYWIYHSFGFRSLWGGFMRYAVEPGHAFEERWFAAAPAEVVPFRWEHWPLTALVTSLPHTCPLSSVAWSVNGVYNLEWPGMRFLVERARGTPVDAVALTVPSGAVVGCATVHPLPAGLEAWPGVWLVDVFTHPNFQDRTGDLVAGLPAREGKLVAYAAADAGWKRDALEACGFAREGLLRGHLRLAGVPPLDVAIYGKESG